MPPDQPERGRPAAFSPGSTPMTCRPWRTSRTAPTGWSWSSPEPPTARGFGLDVASLDAALAGVELDLLPLRLEPAPFSGLDAVRALLEVADARRVPASSLNLDAGIDPIGSLARTGEAPQPLARPGQAHRGSRRSLARTRSRGTAAACRRPALSRRRRLRGAGACRGGLDRPRLSAGARRGRRAARRGATEPVVPAGRRRRPVADDRQIPRPAPPLRPVSRRSAASSLHRSGSTPRRRGA